MDQPKKLVETVLGKVISDGILKYEVKWKGYPTSENTLEPLESLQSCPEKVKEFENKYRKSEETLDCSNFDNAVEQQIMDDLWENGTLEDIVALDTETDTMTLLWDTGDFTEQPSHKVKSDCSDFDKDAEQKVLDDLWDNGTLVDIVALDTETDSITLLWDTGDLTEQPAYKVVDKYPHEYIKFSQNTLYQLTNID